MAGEDTFDSRTWKNWTVPSFVDVDGVATAYRRNGEGESVLYLHGHGTTRTWAPVHQALATRFDVVAPEHPGFGDTLRHPDQTSFDDFVLHYDGFLRALGLGKLHLVGASLGAWFAANLAIFYPERFASLTLVTPFGLRIEDEPLIDTFRFTPEDRRSALFNGRDDRHGDILVQEEGIEDVLRIYDEDTTAALLHWNPRYDYKLDRRLARLRLPTVVVAAEDDRIVGNEQATRYVELLPDAELVILPGPASEPSAHGLVFEQPEDVAAAVARAVDRSAAR